MVDFVKILGFAIGFFGTLVLFLVIMSFMPVPQEQWCTSQPMTPYHDSSLVIPIGIVIGLALLAIIYYYVYVADDKKEEPEPCQRCKKSVICPHCGEEFTPKRWGDEK